MAAAICKSPEQLMARRQKVSELYSEGTYSMAEICGLVGVKSVQTVYSDICWAREQWRTKCSEAIDKLKMRELARIDHLEAEAWKAWKRSIGIHTKTTKKSGTRPGPQGGAFEEEREEKEKLAGDPRFLDVVSKCIESRRKILGIDAPQQLTGSDGGPVVVQFAGISQNLPWLTPKN